MSGALPTAIDPVLLADRNGRLTGRMSVRSLPRLRALLLDDNSEIEVDLHFERAEGSNVRRMLGRLSATVSVTCQRCLEPMRLPLAAEPNTVLLQDGEREGGMALEADVLTVGTSVALAELVEDELVLAMPMVPMHELDDCSARKFIGGGDKERNPFATLAKVKT